MSLSHTLSHSLALSHTVHRCECLGLCARVLCVGKWSLFYIQQKHDMRRTWPKPSQKARDNFFALVWFFRYRSRFGLNNHKVFIHTHFLLLCLAWIFPKSSFTKYVRARAGSTHTRHDLVLSPTHTNKTRSGTHTRIKTQSHTGHKHTSTRTHIIFDSGLSGLFIKILI